MLGKDQPVILQLLELPIDKAQAALKGVMMELEDCAFPLLAGMVGTDDPKVAFKDADIALLVGARPRGPGMERKDLLLENAKIFTAQGKALEQRRHRATSRCWSSAIRPTPTRYIAMKSAPSTCRRRTSPRCCASTTTARCRSSPPRPASAVGDDREARRLGQPLADDVRRLPLRHRRRRKSVKDMINDEDWNRNVFLPHGRQARRGDHRGARPVVGGVGRQRRDRPRPRLGARHAAASG